MTRDGRRPQVIWEMSDKKGLVGKRMSVNSLPRIACILSVITPIAGLPQMAHAATVTKVAGGQAYTTYIMSDGTLWGMGDGFTGQLGQGPSLTETNLPVQISTTAPVTDIACGQGQTMYLESNGGLWGIGNDDHGELGDGTNVNHYYPEIIADNVTRIGCGDFTSYYQTTVGTKSPTYTLLDMGWNSDGQLGVGPLNAVNDTPETLQSTMLSTFQTVSVAGGYAHSLFALANGRLLSMGLNANGQLGNATTNEQTAPVLIESNDVTTVAAGSYFSLFLKSDNSLWGMGQNAGGELGDGSGLDRHSPVVITTNVTAMAGGNDFSLFLRSNGSLWGMGQNDLGQLGDGTGASHLSPIQIVASNVLAVAAGKFHGLFIKTDGSLWGMGANYAGQLGDGGSNNMYFPVRIVPPPPLPVITGISISGADVTITASNGLLGATYYLFTSTDLTLPMNQWTVVQIAQLNADGDFHFNAINTISPGTRQQFFRIQVLY